MQIIIPMSGTGKRFVDAGYSEPKPLIEVDGKPVIEHVVGLFPGESDFIFICNSAHLRQTHMREALSRIAPTGRIVEIPPHKKGPVFAVSQVFHMIQDDDEAIVNYCDFSVYWDYADFLRHTRARGADGAVPAYKGFHPHMLGSTNYAFMRDERQWMLEIKEKEPFTADRTREYASTGTYYFKKGRYVKKYFEALMERDINLNGEYYVSLVYNLLKEDGLSVSIYEVEHMLQWGAPLDLEEYQAWSDYFRRAAGPRGRMAARPGSINLVPLAGRGARFSKEGYADPKPLIEVSGRPMVVQAAASMPSARRHVFVCLGEHLDRYPLEGAIKGVYPDARIKRLDAVTEGQAVTCMEGLRGEDMDSPLFIGACDNAMLWSPARYEALLAGGDVDAVVWSFKNHPSSKRNPHMYGWIKTDSEGRVLGVSVKKPISAAPQDDHAVVGAFYFARAGYFAEGVERLIKDNIRVNGEFYVDSVIDVLAAIGRRVKVFEVDSYICWGTPDDLRTFEYWQSFFHKCPWHPYSLTADSSVNPSSVEYLDKKYNGFRQPHG